MRYITDRAIEQIEVLTDLTLEERRQAFVDADRVYDYLRRAEGQSPAPGVDVRSVRSWAEKQDNLGPDRLNRALDVLKATDRAVAISS